MRHQLLARGADPMQILYEQLHICWITSSHITVDNLPPTVMVTITDTSASPQDLPTHVLACFSASSPRPYIIPINIERYRRVFRTEIILPGTTLPSPRRTGSTTLALPLLIPATTIPHPSSLVFLLLRDISDNDIAFQMLPSNVVGEFPNAAAMAQIMSLIGKDEFERRQNWNGGIWRNVLGLGMRNERVVNVVRTAWNVTADARRLRPY